jgi:Tfp pilus assembly protein PilX
MLSRIPSYQRGFTLIGFLVVCVLVGFAALCHEDLPSL